MDAFYSRRTHLLFIGRINYYWWYDEEGKGKRLIAPSIMIKSYINKTLDKLLTVEQEDHHADEFAYGAPEQVVAKNFQLPIALPPAHGNAQLEFALVGLPSTSREDRGGKYINCIYIYIYILYMYMILSSTT